MCMVNLPVNPYVEREKMRLSSNNNVYVHLYLVLVVTVHANGTVQPRLCRGSFLSAGY